MKRYLIWSWSDPAECLPLKKIICENRIGSNSGNLAFHTSVERTLMTEGTTFRPVFLRDRGEVTDALTEDLNTYDALLLPLANAFRPGYIRFLEILTLLIRRLRIPCIVLSIGIQLSHSQSPEDPQPFDPAVRDFIRAVLDRSARIGLRGTVTERYLRHLGFSVGSALSVIGCPSLYWNGPHSPESRPFPQDHSGMFAVGSKARSGQAYSRAMDRMCAGLPGYVYIAQRIEEFRRMYTGMDVPGFLRSRSGDHYPLDSRHSSFGKHMSLGFTEFPQWITAMRDARLYFGCNIHGAIPALLAGTPAVLLERDQRVAEIADWFGIPSVKPEQFAGLNSVEDLAPFAAKSGLQARYPDRFRGWIAFLEANGLEHVWNTAEPGMELPFDRMYALREHTPVLTYDGSTPMRQKLSALPILLQQWKEVAEKIREGTRHKATW